MIIKHDSQKLVHAPMTYAVIPIVKNKKVFYNKGKMTVVVPLRVMVFYIATIYRINRAK